MQHPSRLLPGALLTLTLAACQLGGPATTPHASAVKAVVNAKATTDVKQTPAVVPAVKKQGSVLATAAATAAASATPAAGQRLLKPTAATSELSGLVTLDASYIIANNAGSLISNNGSGILAAGALKSSGDGRLVSDHGGGLISDNGGNVIVASSNGILSDQGTGILSNNSSSLIANNGGGLAGGKKFALLDTTTASYGALLPAAGVQLGVRSLSTGKPVAIGVDAAGHPVYSVYTNVTGAFKIYLPDSEAHNVLVEAHVPDTTDARQGFTLVTPKDAGSAKIDEDSGLSSREIQEIFAGRLTQFMVGEPASWLCIIGGSGNLSTNTKQILTAALTDLHDHARAAGVTADPAMAPAVRDLTWRCANAMLSTIVLSEVRMGGGVWGQEKGERDESAFDAITEVFRAGREAATRKLGAEPNFFDNQPYFVTANACAPGRYAINKPADLNSFLIGEYLIDGSDPGLYWAGTVFDSLDAHADADGVGLQHKLNTAMDSFATAMATAILGNAHGELDALHALIAAFDPKAVPADMTPSNPPSSCPRPPARSGLSQCLSATSASTPAAAPSPN